MIYQKLLYLFLILIFHFCLCIEKKSAFVKIGISKVSPKNSSETANATTTTTTHPTKENLTETSTPTTVTTTTIDSIQNSTNSTTTTLEATSTTTSPSTESTTKPTTPKPNITATPVVEPPRKLRTFNPSYYCACDFQLNFCDLNCCCDIDCPNDVLKTFTCSAEHRTLHDYEYQQGLPSCSAAEGWLCVLKDNSKLQSGTKYNPNLDISKKFSRWPDPFETEATNFLDYYKYGDPILLFDAPSGEIITLDLPYPLVGPECEVAESVRFLKDFKRNCLMAADSIQELVKELSIRFNNSKLLPTRKQSNIEPLAEFCGKDQTCIEFHIFSCPKIDTNVDSVKDCLKLTNSSIDDSYNDYIPFAVDLLFYHNFTSLRNSTIKFYLEQKPSYDSLDLKKWFFIDVRFLDIDRANETMKRTVSGNLGYKEEKPIIIGRYVVANESAEENEKHLILDYFHPNQSKYYGNHIFPLPSSKYGICTKSALKPINFGESSFTQCYVVPNNETNINSESNFTNFCRNLQENIFSFITIQHNFSTNFELYVSEYGFPINSSKNWIKFELQNYEHIDVVGTFRSELESFVCQNMVIKINYNFITTRLTVHGIPHQNLVKKAIVELGAHVDLEFKLDDEIKIPIYVNVMFYDATDISGCTPINYLSSHKKILIVLTATFLLQFQKFLYKDLI